jgi:hypothetical protein
MKTCAQCHGKLGLGVRAPSFGTAAGGFTFASVRLLYQLERHDVMNETRASRDDATAASDRAPAARWHSYC